MAQLFANNAASTLASAITSTSTSLTLVAGGGAKFPSPAAGDFFLLTLVSTVPETAWEIVKVTARTGDVLTVVRAQEGTAAAAWGFGAKAELRITAGGMDGKQPTLLPGTNIKTINGESLMGAGDIVIGGGTPTGSIQMYAGATAPMGWALCDGALLAITEYQDLFSVIGTIYGGDGLTTFALPNLRGRGPLGSSAAHQLATTGGAESVTLTPDHLPGHTHPANVTQPSVAVTIPVSYNTSTTQVTPDASHNYLATSLSGVMGSAAIWSSTMNQATTIQGVTASLTNSAVTVGSNTTAANPVPTLPPYLALNFIIKVRK